MLIYAGLVALHGKMFLQCKLNAQKIIGKFSFLGKIFLLKICFNVQTYNENIYLNQSPSIYQLSLLEQGHIYLRGQGKVKCVHEVRRNLVPMLSPKIIRYAG